MVRASAPAPWALDDGTDIANVAGVAGGCQHFDHEDLRPSKARPEDARHLR